MKMYTLVLAAVMISGLAACTIKHEEHSESCTFNGQNIPCDQMPGARAPSNRHTHRDDCVNYASSFMNANQVDRVCENANEYTTRCIEEATSTMFKEDVVTVCANARYNSVSCIREHKAHSSSNEIAERCR